MKSEPKLIVFTGDPSYSVIKGILETDRLLPQARWLVLWHSPEKSVATLLRNQWRRPCREAPLSIARDFEPQRGDGGARGGALSRALRPRITLLHTCINQDPCDKAFLCERMGAR